MDRGGLPLTTVGVKMPRVHGRVTSMWMIRNDKNCLNECSQDPSSGTDFTPDYNSNPPRRLLTRFTDSHYVLINLMSYAGWL